MYTAFNIGMYMQTHWKLLHPLCLCSVYQPG